MVALLLNEQYMLKGIWSQDCGMVVAIIAIFLVVIDSNGIYSLNSFPKPYEKFMTII